MTKIEKLRDILKFTIDLVKEVLFTKYLNLHHKYLRMIHDISI